MKSWSGVNPLAWAFAARATAPARVQSLDSELLLAVPIGEAFAFFSEAANLDRLTPPWLNFTILTPQPIVMHAGLQIDYRIRLYGLPIPWRSRIDVWTPGVCFVDRQTIGPYRWWRHEHRFEAVGTSTRVIDRVEYAPRAAWVSGRLVRRDLERIFAYRRAALRQAFSTHDA